MNKIKLLVTTVYSSMGEMMNREYNMDLCRTCMMLGIISLHILGGVVDKSIGTPEGWIADFIHTACYCTVDVFAIMMGWFGLYEKRSMIIYRCFQVLFVCLLITIAGNYLGVISTKKAFIEYLFPFMNKRLWYVWSYIAVFLISPYLNFIITNISRSKVQTMLVMQIIILGFGTAAVNYDVFGGIGTGCSVLWLILLYGVGAYIKYYDIRLTISPLIAVMLIMFNVLIQSYSKTILSQVVLMFWKPNFLYKYISPFMTVNAVLLFLIFKDLVRINNKTFQKIIVWLSGVSFGVYIIHAHPLILDVVFYKSGFWYKLLCTHGIIGCLGLIMVSVISVYLICGLAEQMRKCFFDIVHIRDLCVELDKRLFDYIKIS